MRQNLSKYLRVVKEGKSLTVTERGHEVARVVPLRPEIDPVYRRLAEKYGVTAPKGDLVEVARSMRAERGRPGAPGLPRPHLGSLPGR